MIKVVKKFIRLIVGFILCASSTVFMLNSNLGLSPWDVFHQGVSKVIGITIGQASIISSIAVMLIGITLKQKIGIATLLNMIMIGKFMDIINDSNLIPVANNFFVGIIMMIIGMFTMGYGCYLYIGCELGCGPRDGVMVGLSSKFKKPIKLIRGSIEVFVLIIGIILGGKFGIGTFISAFAIGYSIQIVFKLRNFDAVNVKHKSILEVIRI